MAILQVTASSFVQAVKRPGVVVVDWWAPWCGPCRAFAPIFEAVAARHAGVTFAKVDTDAQPGLADACRIEVIPTLSVFRDGELVATWRGNVGEAVLERLIREASERAASPA